MSPCCAAAAARAGAATASPRGPRPLRAATPACPRGQPPASGHHPGAGECGDPATVRGGLLGPPPPPQAESGGGGGGETRGRGQLAAPSVLRLTSSPCPDPGAWTLSPGQSHRWVGAWRGVGGGRGGAERGHPGDPRFEILKTGWGREKGRCPLGASQESNVAPTSLASPWFWEVKLDLPGEGGRGRGDAL